MMILFPLIVTAESYLVKFMRKLLGKLAPLVIKENHFSHRVQVQFLLHLESKHEGAQHLIFNMLEQQFCFEPPIISVTVHMAADHQKINTDVTWSKRIHIFTTCFFSPYSIFGVGLNSFLEKTHKCGLYCLYVRYTVYTKLCDLRYSDIMICKGLYNSGLEY